MATRAQKTIDDAVGHMAMVARLIMLQDFERIKEWSDKHNILEVAPVEKENSFSRGMIYAFAGPDEFEQYIFGERAVLDDGQPPNVFDLGFVSFLSHHLDKSSDRARIVAQRPADGSWCLIADVKIAGYETAAIRNLENYFENIWGENRIFASFFGQADTARVLDVGKIYPRLLGDVYHGDEATRASSAIFYALATGMPVILSRQRVVPQEGIDITLREHDPASDEYRAVNYSRIGTGELLTFGRTEQENKQPKLVPPHLLRRTLLRVNTTADESYHFGYVRKQLGSDELLPVVMEVQHYRYNMERGCVETVVPNRLIPLDEIERFLLKG